MATLILGAVGAAVGAGFGGTILGLSGAVIGRAIGAAVGQMIDSAIIASLAPAARSEGPRLQETTYMGASEGAPQGRLYGRARVNGQVIWTTRFKEHSHTQRSGGKGGGRGASQTSYTYSVSFAVALGEGNTKAQLGRVWLDGKETDLSGITYRFYQGTETQAPDSFIQSIEGVNATPAFRGITYLVIEEMDITDYGNRIPQVTAELIRPLDTEDPDDISNIMRGVCLIPGSGEFVYATQSYTQQGGNFDEDGKFNPNGQPAKSLTVHNMEGKPDLVRSMEQLGLFQPNMETVALVVGWFGDDLRVGNCTIMPKVEFNDRNAQVTPTDWTVAGLNRSEVPQLARDSSGHPVYGGTPSDTVVKEAIVWLKARGYKVVFYPFIFMEIVAGNTLPDPYSNGASGLGQPAFPWRGRITCSPAAGYSGSVDKTAAAATQVANFFNGTWGFRRFINHYADLVAEVGGVEAFLIGSEMVGLSTIRSNANTYPAIARFRSLAAEVRAKVGPSVKLGYAADWSEYCSHRPNDGSNDVFFHLDPLWADTNIDFIGIDNYMPLSDWRDGITHLDYDADQNIVTPHNTGYLKSNIEGGEYYDWYYASQSARNSQTRTPITDTAYGKPWVFRQKDLRNWWLNQHFNRPGGVQSGTATSWVPQSKPIWFTELGCPAVDKGSNQPNVFYDPKSSENMFPYYSTGEQDEYIQRVFLEASLQYWRDEAPTSSVFGGKMLDIEHILVWCWDARPYPDYPLRSDVWADADLWRYGHWLTGRLDAVALSRLVKELCSTVGVTDVDVELLNGSYALVKGFNIDSIMAVRDMIASLMGAYMFDGFESEGKLKFALRSATSITIIDPLDYVSSSSDKLGLALTRQQETELPSSVKIDFIDGDASYAVASLDGKRLFGGSDETAQLQLPLVLEPHYVRGLADSIIHQAWTARERGSVALPPSMFKFDPGDAFQYDVGSRQALGRFQQIDTAEFRKAEFANFDPSLFRLPKYPAQVYSPSIPWAPGFATLVPMDIPLLTGLEPSLQSPRVATYMNPWPGGVNIYRADGGGGWEFKLTASDRAYVGRLAFPLYSGPTGIWDRSNDLYIELFYGSVASKTEAQVFGGANALAVQNQNGFWEILQFKDAVLTAPRQYTLSNLLRGQLGTEHAMRSPVPAGATVVFLTTEMDANPSTAPFIPISLDDRNNPVTLRWGNQGKPVTDSDAYLTRDFVFRSEALMPYSPVQLAGAWAGAGGNIGLSWVRRTRFNGDQWDAPEVPLNEETELYDLQILDGSSVVREVTNLTSPAYTYTTASQVTDFGSAQSTLTFRVYQLSSKVGRGHPGQQTVYR